jgi:hypothetical protein
MLIEKHLYFRFIRFAHGGGGDGDFVARSVGARGGEGVDAGEGGVVGVQDAEGCEGGCGDRVGGVVGEALVALEETLDSVFRWGMLVALQWRGTGKTRGGSETDLFVVEPVCLHLCEFAVIKFGVGALEY